ncbi:MAG TPA: biotin--[acetyl-CoA-carboxylase] ligase [Gemmatimonadaceae bacterium]|nr:biotin--[acetyl-CoA-carboxylase] ligase [Gemmatimonadaceae bacterium]
MRADSEATSLPGDQLFEGGATGRYCGLSQAEIGELTGAPHALLFGDVSSTMDVAHEAAANGAPSGTIVLAEHQRKGRGRGGNEWRSEPASGVWLTLVERPWEGAPVELMSIRAGLALAPALDRFATAPIGLKWPNDLYVHGRKLGGILLEARWRDGRAEWVALGVGINVTPPADMSEAAGLRQGVTALEILAAIVPALRRALTRRGPLSASELDAFGRRDITLGKRCREPAAGIARGINESGELLVESSGAVSAHRSGSLVLETPR